MDTEIDYSMGSCVNRDPKTGIRFGVIPAVELGSNWYEDSEAVYVYYCPKCGKYLRKGSDARRCPACRYNINQDRDFDGTEPEGYKYVREGYKAFQTDPTDIFVEKSPYFTYAQFCSPCAPGACYLINYLDEPSLNNKAYCFGHDWFESGKAPYKVYDMKTGKVVEPKP